MYVMCIADVDPADSLIREREVWAAKRGNLMYEVTRDDYDRVNTDEPLSPSTSGSDSEDDSVGK